jgi:cytochrome c
MSTDLTFNKMAGAMLATVLAIVGLEEISNIVYHPEVAKKPGYAIAVQADTTDASGPAAPELPPDWGTVLPAANIQAGMQVAMKCQSCHNLEKGGPNLTGPNLYGVLGRKPGSHPGFAYSAGMQDFGMKTAAWTYDEVNTFISGPAAYINGTKMTFVGLKKQDDRINVIAYLRTLNDSPPPIPAPNPAAAAPAAAAGATAPAGAAVTAPAGAPAAANPPAATTPAQSNEGPGSAQGK